MRIKYILYITIVCILLEACKKGDEEAPSLSISQPIENEQYQAGDTIRVKGIASDDEQVTSIKISLLDGNYTSVVTTKYIQPNVKEYILNEDFILDEPNLVSGVYTLQVSATDGENTSNAFISLNIVELDFVFEKLVAFCQPNTLKTYVYSINAEGEVHNILNLSHGYVDSDISSRHRQLYVVKPEPSILSAYNLDFLSEDYAVHASLPYPFFSDVHNNVWDMTYVASANGDIKAFNPNGSISMLTQTSTDTIPVMVLRQGLYLVAYCERRGGPQKYLRKYQTFTGAWLASVDIDITANDLFFSDGNMSFVFGNDDVGGCIYPYHVPDNVLENRVGIPSGNLHCTSQLGTFSFLIAGDDAIYRYDYYNGNLIEWMPLGLAGSMAFDWTREIVYIARGSVITVASLSDATILKEIQMPYKVLKIHVQYNK